MMKIYIKPCLTCLNSPFRFVSSKFISKYRCTFSDNTSDKDFIGNAHENDGVEK